MDVEPNLRLHRVAGVWDSMGMVLDMGPDWVDFDIPTMNWDRWLIAGPLTSIVTDPPGFRWPLAAEYPYDRFWDP